MTKVTQNSGFSGKNGYLVVPGEPNDVTIRLPIKNKVGMQKMVTKVNRVCSFSKMTPTLKSYQKVISEEL